MLTVNRPPLNRLLIAFLFVMTMSWLVGCEAITKQSQDNGQNHNPVQPTVEQPEFNGHIKDYDGCTQAPTDAVNQICASKDGIMKRVGMMGCYRCIVSYTDAHQSCQDNSECQGKCLAKSGEFIKAGTSNVTGVCAKSNSPFGCFQVINNGIAQSAMCVD